MKRYRLNGKFVSREEFLEEKKGIDSIIEVGQMLSQSNSTYPMESYAAGVLPSEIKEARELDRKMGVPTDYNPKTGDAIFTGPKHRKKYCEAHGLFDRNGGYGDPQKS